MSLLTSELARIKAELGFNLLNIGAEPYIGVTSLFEQVIQPYLTAGAITSSSTTVAAATSPTRVTLTLTSGTGFALFDRVVVDIDGEQELATVRSVSGNAIDLLLSGGHSGTYPVTVEGGEAIVREALRRIQDVKAQMAQTFGEGTLKKVDEVEFYQIPGSLTLFGNLGTQLSFWREELAANIGMQSMWSRRASGSQRLSVY